MFFSSFLIFMITLVAGMIISSNCSLFLVFHIWVSIVIVSVTVSFFAFGGCDKDGIFRICCDGVFCFCVKFDNNTSKYFCFYYSQCKDGLYSLFYHTICNLGISNIFDWSIYIFDH